MDRHNDESRRLAVYSTFCGPKALAALTGLEHFAAAFVLDRAHRELNLGKPRDGTSHAAMLWALKALGYDVYERSPRHEGFRTGGGGPYGTWHNRTYRETRYTLAQYMRRGEAKQGHQLVVCGTQDRCHYVLLKAGKVAYGVWGGVPRRRVWNVTHIRKGEAA